MNNTETDNLTYKNIPAPTAFASETMVPISPQDLSGVKLFTDYFNTNGDSVLNDTISADAVTYNVAIKLVKLTKEFHSPAPKLEDKVRKARVLFEQTLSLLSKETFYPTDNINAPDEILSSGQRLYKHLMKNKKRNIKLIMMSESRQDDGIKLKLAEALKMDGEAVTEWKLIKKHEDQRRKILSKYKTKKEP